MSALRPAYLRAQGKPRTLAYVRAHRCVVGSQKGPPITYELRQD